MSLPDTATTADEGSLLHLELIRQNTLTEQETIILNVFARGIQPATAEAAAEAAHQFDILCPPLEQEDEANDYLWMVWRIMITVARSPDVTNEVHIRLVSILDILRQFAKGNLDVHGVSAYYNPFLLAGAQSNHVNFQSNLRVWRDFPQLNLCMEAYFSGMFSCNL